MLRIGHFLLLVVLLVLADDFAGGFTMRKGYQGSYSKGNDALQRYLGFRIGDVGQGCVCMNWRSCEGTIDPYPTNPCTPSYSFVCCIQPTPESIPGEHNNYNEDCDEFTDDTVLEIPGLEEIPNKKPCTRS